jgi:hypothetical protein
VASAISAVPVVLVLAALALSASCVKDPDLADPDDDKEYGMIAIRASLVNPPSSPLAKSAEAAGVHATVAEKLVIEVSGDDLAPVRIERKVDFSRPTVSDTVAKVPVGKNRRIEIWAADKNGVKTHIDSLENRAVNIEIGVVTPVFATLIPAAGSIYLQFAGLGTDVSVVHATFTGLDDGALIAHNTVNRAAKTFMSLDNIPHMTTGILRIAIVGTSGDTTQIASRELTFNARINNSIDLQFMAKSGMFEMEVVLHAPGVTTGSYDFKTLESAVVETGELIITEIMWNASNDNYIELYNPGNTAVFFDTLTTDIDASMASGGAVRYFIDVTIAPKSYFVIGRQNLPHFDTYTPTTSGLPIAATGSWITVKRGRNGAVVDRVIFAAGTSNTTGWPSLSTTNKRSIELARDRYDATDNNFGKYWSAATQLISVELGEYGTPGF